MSLPVVEKVAPSVKPSSNWIASSKESTCRISTKALVILMGVTSFLIIGLTYHDGAVINYMPFQEIFVEDSERVGGLSSNRNLMFDKKNFETLYLHNNANDKHIPRPMHKLVDFVIAGFPKCGTTTMLKMLNHNPQVYMGGDESPTKKKAGERHELRHTKEHYFNEFFDRYSMENIDKGTNLEGPGGKVLKQVVGFKSPEVLRSETFLSNVVDFFPGVDLVVSMRHPVLHFQSNYNFKLRMADSTLKLPDTKDLIGDCAQDCLHDCTPKVPYIDSSTHKEGHAGGDLCTMLSTYHYALSRLALTPIIKEEEENNLLAANPYHEVSSEDEWRVQADCFYWNLVGQMADTDPTRHDKFERSFEDFLGIEANSFTTERKHHQPTPKLINICDDEHREVREHLNGISRESSKWITDYLLRSDRVVDSGEQRPPLGANERVGKGSM